MILLDTNVVSELMRHKPEPAVPAWLDAQEAPAVYISVITEAELHYGVAILPEGRRRARLAAELDKMLEEEFGRHCGVEVINPWPATPDTTEAQSADGS